MASTDVTRVWTLLSERIPSPGPGAGSGGADWGRIREALDEASDAAAVILACAERMAHGHEALRARHGTFLALELARRTDPTTALDERIDPVVGLLSHRAPNHQELVYGRIPAARLALVLARALDARTGDDQNSLFAHWAVAALRLAPEATPAFLAYLDRNRMRPRIVRGDCAKAFRDACAAAPRIAEHARSDTEAKSARSRPEIGPFVITETARLGTARDAARLGETHAAQFVAAVRRVSGDKKVKTLPTALASRPREGSEGPYAGALHVVSDPRGARYDLWTFHADTGVLFDHGETKVVGVDWMQGSFEAARPSLEPLATALEAATWSRAPIEKPGRRRRDSNSR